MTTTRPRWSASGSAPPAGAGASETVTFDLIMFVLVGTYVVFTPVLGYLVLRRRSSPLTVLGVLTALAGLAVLSWHNTTFGLGEILCLVAALFYAAQIVSMGAWAVVGWLPRAEAVCVDRRAMIADARLGGAA